MLYSILIVSHNRYNDLKYTLSILKKNINLDECEILVLLDNCTDNSNILIEDMPWVKWYSSEKRLWASTARNFLYKNAKGEFFIGFDDDAHPLQPDFLIRVKDTFEKNPDVAILAFTEIRGLFNSNSEAIEQLKSDKPSFYTNEFVGCGFAIRSSVYKLTQGFPLWMDIYCEESCVSIEVQAMGYHILHTNEIAINHRVNKKTRRQQGRNYFRFKKQLRNEANYFIVYYPNPIKALIRLFWNNLKGYGVKNLRYFFIYIITFFKVIFDLPKTLKYRNPVKQEVIIQKRHLQKYRAL